MLRSFLIGLGCLCASSAQAGVVFSNFGPGDSHADWGYAVYGPGPAGESPVSIGAQFVAQRSESLASIDVVFFLPANVTLGLYADDGAGGLGAQLESFTLSSRALPVVLTAWSQASPSLTAGARYWLVASAQTDAAWNYSLGHRGPILYASDGALSYFEGDQPVFRVHGVDAQVAEPASLALLGIGLAGLGARRRRQRARSGAAPAA